MHAGQPGKITVFLTDRTISAATARPKPFFASVTRRPRRVDAGRGVEAVWCRFLIEIEAIAAGVIRHAGFLLADVAIQIPANTAINPAQDQA